jgi:hypothetical protein
MVASAFFLYYLISEDVPSLLKNPDPKMMAIIPWLGLAIVGTIISFFKRIIGSILMLAGGAAVVITLYMQSGLYEFPMMLGYGIPYVLGGFLLLIVKD